MPGRIGVEAAIFQAVFERLAQRLACNVEAPLAVAVSGGGDSSALLILAQRWAASAGRRLHVLHVDHGLNSDSAYWARSAQALARQAGATFEGLAWTGDKPATGLPAAARRARHALLAEAARRAGARVILFAHTADDVAEADIMRSDATPAFGRLQDWAPCPVWPEGRDVFLLRPLLTVGREALRRLLFAEGVSPVEDPANADARFARSRARLALASGRIAPPGAPERGPLNAGAAARVFADGSIRLPRDAVQEAGAALLGPAVLAASGGETPPRRVALERLLASTVGGRRLIATLAGARIIVDDGTIELFREVGEYRRRGRPRLILESGAAVFDGRFLIETETAVEILPVHGLAARLDREEARRLAATPASARAGLPLTRAGARLALPSPFGSAPARATALAGPRLRAACGLVAHESEISRKSMAEPRLTPYVRAEGSLRALRQ